MKPSAFADPKIYQTTRLIDSRQLCLAVCKNTQMAMAWCDYCVIKSVRWGLPLQAFVTVTCARRIEGRHVTCRSGSLWFGLVRYIQRHPSDQSQTRLNFFALGVKQLAPTSLENRNGLEPPCCGWLLGVVAFCFRLEVWSVQFSTPVLGSPLEVPFILTRVVPSANSAAASSPMLIFILFI